MGRRSRRRRRQRAANARAKARSIAARRRSSVVKKKTPTRTRRTIARLRTPITRKAPITRRTTSTRTRRKITSTARKTRRRTVAAKPVVPTAAQRKRARRRAVIRTTVPTAAQRKRARTKQSRRRVVNSYWVKRNKRDRGFTKVTRVPTRFRPADTVSRRAGRIVTRPRGALTSPFELDVQGDQSPTTFFDRRNQSGRRLAGERGGGVFTRDSDGLPVDDGVPRGDRRPPRPSPTKQYQSKML